MSAKSEAAKYKAVLDAIAEALPSKDAEIAAERERREELAELVFEDPSLRDELEASKLRIRTLEDQREDMGFGLRRAQRQYDTSLQKERAARDSASIKKSAALYDANIELAQKLSPHLDAVIKIWRALLDNNRRNLAISGGLLGQGGDIATALRVQEFQLLFGTELARHFGPPDGGSFAKGPGQETLPVVHLPHHSEFYDQHERIRPLADELIEKRDYAVNRMSGTLPAPAYQDPMPAAEYQRLSGKSTPSSFVLDKDGNLIMDEPEALSPADFAALRPEEQNAYITRTGRDDLKVRAAEVMAHGGEGFPGLAAEMRAAARAANVASEFAWAQRIDAKAAEKNIGIPAGGGDDAALAMMAKAKRLNEARGTADI